VSAAGEGGKRHGKTQWAGRRRPVTRRAGFTSHPDATGGELEVAGVGGWALAAGASLEVRFRSPPAPPGALLGFGAWYFAPPGCEVELDFPGRTTLVQPAAPDWSKFGSQWYQEDDDAVEATFRISTDRDVAVALWSPQIGIVRHEFFDDARPALLRNNHQFAPEANFVEADAHGDIDYVSRGGAAREVDHVTDIALKSCNRCARFLPINVHNERLALSYSNHCVAPQRVPCRHATFGRLRNVATGEPLQLRYGFQLECRFCKKFAVNAALNPQRTAAQMKEDGARRRSFELLLQELYGGTPNLRYRATTGGRELTDDVYDRFGGRCFKCGTHLASARDMHLDHTRPLALLWPLDGTATALCATHNSEKRDRAPSEYYDADELARLSAITGVPLEQLRDPGPNGDAIDRLTARLDWFFGEFLKRDELQRVQDGKRPADLLVRALQKAIDREPAGARFDVAAAYRRHSRSTA
jgi:hypothetical protein